MDSLETPVNVRSCLCTVRGKRNIQNPRIHSTLELYKLRTEETRQIGRFETMSFCCEAGALLPHHRDSYQQHTGEATSPPLKGLISTRKTPSRMHGAVSCCSALVWSFNIHTSNKLWMKIRRTHSSPRCQRHISLHLDRFSVSFSVRYWNVVLTTCFCCSLSLCTYTSQM